MRILVALRSASTSALLPHFQVVYGGCLDDARNERDMDQYQGGRQTCGTWTFGIDGNGTLTNFSESYY